MPIAHLADQRRSRGGEQDARLVLELYVAGTMPHSLQAISDIKRLCTRWFKGRYALRVFDITRNPQLASVRQILALPTLIKVKPEPSRRIIGDLSDAERVTAALGLSNPGEVA